ncbi:MAG: hypothetical protein GY729_14190 [Desulfobacteraceae bacterium]|nr:hypothetical protein [Desulfobacteraceae bacterium]
MRKQKTNNRDKDVSRWIKRLKKRYLGSSRPCLHVMSGVTCAPKICVWDYECYHCEYDQMLDAVL